MIFEGEDAAPAAPAVRHRHRHLARAGAGGPHRAGVAPVRDLRRLHRGRAGRRVPAADVDHARRRGGRADRHHPGGEGLRRLREPQRAAGRHRVPGRAGGREVGARAPHQPVHGRPLRRLVARTGVQHRADRRRHRAGFPQQHGARRGAVPDRAVRRAGIGVATGRPGGTAARRLPDVLRHGEPRRVVGAVDDGDVGESDRAAGRQGVRHRDRLRQVVPRGVRARARRDPRAAARRGEDLPAAGRAHARGAAGGTQGAVRTGTARARRVDHRGRLPGDGRRVDLRRRAEAQRDEHRVRRPGRAADDARAHAGRHRHAGRHAVDVPVARRAVRAERAAQRARLHGLRGADARRADSADCRGR